jgi:hypothetical protein
MVAVNGVEEMEDGNGDDGFIGSKQKYAGGHGYAYMRIGS